MVTERSAEKCIGNISRGALPLLRPTAPSPRHDTLLGLGHMMPSGLAVYEARHLFPLRFEPLRTVTLARGRRGIRIWRSTPASSPP